MSALVQKAPGCFSIFQKTKSMTKSFDGLIALAVARDLEGYKKRLFAGDKINATEQRAVLHVALRDYSKRAYHVDGENVSIKVHAELEKMRSFVERVHRGEFCGYSGEKLDTVVNIGIGGSDLGPLMAVEALRPYWVEGRRSFFVSNVDGQHMADVLEQVDPAQARLFLVASKTFTTQETMTNANTARDWFLANGGKLTMMSQNTSPRFQPMVWRLPILVLIRTICSSFGIGLAAAFSMWSAIGLSVALQVGFDNFEKMLRGAHAMDEHFRTAPLRENLPVLLGLIGVWNRNFVGATTLAVLPYDQHLHRLAAYLQQGEMESNGKSTSIDGARVGWATCPVVFGEPGTNGQHAFYQLIHQGTDIIASDFIAPALSQSPLGDHHEILLSNFLAQTEALMLGKTVMRCAPSLPRMICAKTRLTRWRSIRCLRVNAQPTRF